MVTYIRTNFLIGYEALIGLLKWSIPIKPERTLSHLFGVLYQKICLKKVPSLQTNEYIQFRSRCTYNTFPFDLTPFKSSKHALQSKKEAYAPGASTSTSSKCLLPVSLLKRTRYSHHHLFEVELAAPSLMITEAKLYLGLDPSVENFQYKLILKIFSADTNSLLYFNTFEEQIFAQFAHPVKVSQGPLHIPNLSLQGRRFKFVLEFGSSYSSIPKSAHKGTSIDSLLELYGQSNDVHVTQATLKGMLDKKA